uniref:hypothetical protein n=1 Tax=Paractinoplanes polyasparticus TaxID=2856853 RepID=UPI001C84ACCF|nr:hypothetical protein [Actinoplanes polyasparticus]
MAAALEVQVVRDPDLMPLPDLGELRAHPGPLADQAPTAASNCSFWELGDPGVAVKTNSS